MAIVNIQNTNTFDEWRIKTNEIGAQLGDVSGSGITNSATTTFAGLTGINANDFVGTAATFTVSNVAGTYTVAITQAGTGYADSDTILIKGSLIGGVDGTNDATITVTGQTGGNIDTATIAGTASPGLASEFKLVQEYVDPTQTLNTTATTLADAINEHEANRSAAQQAREARQRFLEKENKIEELQSEVQEIKGILKQLLERM